MSDFLSKQCLVGAMAHGQMTRLLECLPRNW